MRHMVRKMVGTLVEVGRGKLVPGDIAGTVCAARSLEIRPDHAAAGTLPGKCGVSGPREFAGFER